ncbi:hypothetical protein HAX54_010403, partial [Datura stramonium]|nr:hypothetical protein [Datura stramonium]
VSRRISRGVRKLARMLKVVLELVVATDSGIQELKSDILNLTQLMKDHEVSFRQLGERMNVLASWMESKASMITHELTKEETTLTPSAQMRVAAQVQEECTMMEEKWGESTPHLRNTSENLRNIGLVQAQTSEPGS